MKELTEVLQRQKTRVAALQKDRADMTAQLASYQPAEQDKLRAEMGSLRERVGELAGIKARGTLQFNGPITMFVVCQCVQVPVNAIMFTVVVVFVVVVVSLTIIIITIIIIVLIPRHCDAVGPNLAFHKAC